ncbi:MAG: methyltransferase domain-containing protein [Flammeovirgaceae bacterium]|nr:methyltransferase domain-containing protein [Flammeovirgaceae bacterium]
MNKLHKNLVEAVTTALRQIFDEHQYADQAIERLLKANAKWGSRDRAFIAETTYEIVRWWRWIWELLERSPTSPHYWKAVGVWLFLKEYPLPDWQEFQDIHFQKIAYLKKKLEPIRKIRQSVPDWLDELGWNELGEQWDATLQKLNEPAQVVLRVNRLKTNVNTLVALLQKENIIAQPYLDDALILPKRQNVFATKAFKDGLFEVQDFSSQQVAPMLDVKAGMRVVDACAGAGGKTLHLASLMNNKGKIIALDTEVRKLEELKRRARRAGASDMIETRLIENAKTVKRLYDSADRLLLDVPCSGLGVLRRNPDAKWKLSPSFIEHLQKLQEEILNEYHPICKVGGKVVYATCSVLPSENEHQIQKFLQKYPDKFVLIEEKRILPQENGFDGFYIAVLERKN